MHPGEAAEGDTSVLAPATHVGDPGSLAWLSPGGFCIWAVNPMVEKSL